MPPLPSFPLRFLSRFLGIFRHRNVIVTRENEEEESPMGECYACTQTGVPAFHSTSCDRSHSPEWEAGAGSSLIPIQGRGGGGRKEHGSRAGSAQCEWIFGRVLDPRSKRVQQWNRAFLLARGVSLAIDPLFFYSLSIGRDGAPCLYMDGGLAAVVTALRTLTDAVHLLHVWLQLRLAYVSRESLVVGCGKLVWDAQDIASHYLRSLRGFWFDAFVIIPVPQISVASCSERNLLSKSCRDRRAEIENGSHHTHMDSNFYKSTANIISLWSLLKSTFGALHESIPIHGEERIHVPVF